MPWAAGGREGPGPYLETEHLIDLLETMCGLGKSGGVIVSIAVDSAVLKDLFISFHHESDNDLELGHGA